MASLKFRPSDENLFSGPYIVDCMGDFEVFREVLIRKMPMVLKLNKCVRDEPQSFNKIWIFAREGK